MFFDYRKIYDDLSDGSIKVEDENGQVMGRVTAISTSGIGEQPTSQTVTLPHGIQITTHGGAFPSSLQTIPISGQAATVVQYPSGQQGQEGQFIYAAAPGDVEVSNVCKHMRNTSMDNLGKHGLLRCPHQYVVLICCHDGRTV